MKSTIIHPKLVAAFAATGLCLSTQALRADDTTSSQRSTATAAEKSERQTTKHGAEASHFITDAAHGGMMEVKMGQLAVEKGQSPAVKEFGRRLVADHTKANEELMQLAQKKGIELPKENEKKHDKMMDHLSGLSGAEFDKAFAQHAVKDHQKDIKKFEMQSTKGQDADVKAFATKTLPTLRDHLRLAQSLPGAEKAAIEPNEAAGAERKAGAGDKANDQKVKD